MSLNFRSLHRRGFLKALGSMGLALSAWSLRLLPELGTARSSLASAAGPSTGDHPLTKFKPVKHVEPAGGELDAAAAGILASDDVRHVAASSGFDPGRLTPGKVSFETDAEGRTLTIGTWGVDDKHVLIYASLDRRLEWFKSFSMVVTTDTEIGQVKAYTLNGHTPASVKPQSAPRTDALTEVTAALGTTQASAGYYGFCCGSYYSCCYDQWGTWHAYWQWTGASPCGVDWKCATEVCGVPCAWTCAVQPELCIQCILLVCGFAAIYCTRWCNTCYYCYET